jgi:hypothetical protein
MSEEKLSDFLDLQLINILKKSGIFSFKIMNFAPSAD